MRRTLSSAAPLIGVEAQLPHKRIAAPNLGTSAVMTVFGCRPVTWCGEQGTAAASAIDTLTVVDLLTPTRIYTRSFRAPQNHSSHFAERGLGVWSTRRRPFSGDFAFARLGRQVVWMDVSDRRN